MNFKWGSVNEIAIIILIMTEANITFPSTSKMEFFVTSAND